MLSGIDEPFFLLGLPLEFGRASRGGLPLLHREPVRGASATVPGGRRQAGHLVVMITVHGNKHAARETRLCCAAWRLHDRPCAQVPQGHQQPGC